jgi:hypothetical protein
MAYGAAGPCHCGKWEVGGGGGWVSPQRKRLGLLGRRRPGRRGFRRTRAGAGGVPAVGGRGGVLVPHKWPVPLSRFFGGGLESHINPLKSVVTASGWCGVGHHHVPAKCARGYPRKRP